MIAQCKEKATMMTNYPSTTSILKGERNLLFVAAGDVSCYLKFKVCMPLGFFKSFMSQKSRQVNCMGCAVTLFKVLIKHFPFSEIMFQRELQYVDFR